MGFIVNKRGMIVAGGDGGTLSKKTMNGYEQARVKRKEEEKNEIEAADRDDRERKAAAGGKNNVMVVDKNTKRQKAQVDAELKNRYAAAGADAPSESNRIKTNGVTTDAAGSGVQINVHPSKKVIKKSRRMNQAGPSASKIRPYK